MSNFPLLPEHRVEAERRAVHDHVLKEIQQEAASTSRGGIVGCVWLFVVLLLWPVSVHNIAPFGAVNGLNAAHQLSAKKIKSVASEPQISAEGDLLIAAQAWEESIEPKPDPESGSSSDSPATPLHAPTEAGVYLTANSIARDDKFFVRTMEAIKQAGGNALVIDVKEHDVFFTTDSELAHALHLVRPRYDLPDVVATAHEQGLRVIARFVAAKDQGLAGIRPDTHIRHPEHNTSVGSVWVDPANPTVLEYNKQLLKEVVAAGVDEINLDYIRYPTEYSNEQVGLNGQQKADRVEQFVRMARETIDSSNHKIKLGVSTYAILGWNYEVNLERLGQDVVRFAPYVDVISPMAYPASFAKGHYYDNRFGRSRMYELVYRTLTGYADLLGPEHANKLRPWIQGYRTTAKDARDQIDAVYDAGLCGFTVWSPSNLYAPVYQALPEIEVPRHCA